MFRIYMQVLTGTSFEGANVEGVDFSEAAIVCILWRIKPDERSNNCKTCIFCVFLQGTFDLRNLCRNPTLRGANPTTGADTKLSAGCS
jgi:hypothetical protein